MIYSNFTTIDELLKGCFSIFLSFLRTPDRGPGLPDWANGQGQAPESSINKLQEIYNVLP